jgi:hypothetical protein
MLPREIHVENRPDQTCYDLPVRPLGALRWVGLVPMGFAVLFVWMPASQLIHFLTRALQGGGGFEWFFAAFLAAFVGAGLFPFALGLFVLLGRTRLKIRPDHMVATELAGPFRWSRTIRFNHVERLEFGSGARPAPGNTPKAFAGISGIAAILKDGKRQPVVIGYPREWLEPLLEEVVSTMRMRGTPVPVKEATLDRAPEVTDTEARLEKPAATNMELTDTGWGVELRAPSRGLWKESYGMLRFGLFWCLIVGAISTGVLLGHTQNGSRLGAAAFLALFWLVGIAMLLAGIHLGTRRWTFKADRSELRVALKSALRSREWRWSAGEIADIQVGDSGTRVNDRMIEQLQVHPQSGGRKIGLLSGRTHEELAWAATTLRGALGMSSPIESEAEPPRRLSAREKL